VVRGSRGDYAVFCAAGIVTALAYLWLPDLALLVVGTVVAVLAGAALIASTRRGRDWRQHQALTRELWVAASRIPPGRVLADPGTGDLIRVERVRGSLTLVLAVPPRCRPEDPAPGKPEDPAQGRPEGRPGDLARGRPEGPAPVVARYLIGRWGAPVRPPVRRRSVGAADASTRGGAVEISTAELAKLVDQVLRTAVFGAAG
jgi:hypothetical protein